MMLMRATTFDQGSLATDCTCMCMHCDLTVDCVTRSAILAPGHNRIESQGATFAFRRDSLIGDLTGRFPKQQLDQQSTCVRVSRVSFLTLKAH
jgi:hypothetical protein